MPSQARSFIPIEESSTHYKIKGKVIDYETKDPVSYASIVVLGSTQGVTTAEDGTFLIKSLPNKTGRLRISSIGYTTLDVNYTSGETLLVELRSSSFNIDEIVVSANRTETKRRVAPVLVNVTDAKLFKATSSVDLDQALKFNPGIRIEDNCQNCGFNQVRINGLDGPYSQIVINSRSIFSALAGVYGLEMFPTEMIDRVEVVRGGGSALFGSSAIGGTINIITKAPTRNMTSFSYNTELYHNNLNLPAHNANFFSSVVSDDFKSGISIFGRMKQREGIDLVRDNSSQPGGKDGFSELPKLNSSTVGTSAYISILPETKISLDYFYTQEERRGGDNLEAPEHEAHIAESLRHKIHTGIIRLDQYLCDGKGYLTTFFAGSRTLRNSYYGGGPLIPNDLDIEPTKVDKDFLDAAKSALGAYGITKDLTLQSGIQYVHNFDKLLFMPSELTAGLEHTYDKLNDNSGNRPLTINQKTNTTSAIFQNEWKNDRFGILLGLRYDHVNLSTDEEIAKEGLQRLNVLTPRTTLRYNPLSDLNLRFSYAEGFRAPAYFEEELHVAFANGEGKPRILAKDLKEERSKSLTASADYYSSLSPNISLNFMVEGFFTRILNKFAAVEQNDITYVKNTDENGKPINASVYGANFEVRLGYKNLSSLQLGFTAQKSVFDEEHEALEGAKPMRQFVRTPDTYGYFVWTLTPHKSFSFNLSGDYTGKMYVPHEHGDKIGNYITNYDENKIILSSPFFSLNTKMAYEFRLNNTQIEFNVGVNNLFNSYQKDFDEGPTRASDYIYGPKTPRTIFGGFKISL